MARKLRLLIIEDEEPILRGLISEFEYQGYEVDFCWDGAEGLKKALAKNYDLLLVDLMLPSMSGLELCEKVKHSKPKQAVIILTAKCEEHDVVAGLHLGVDDYITKPFSLSELVLRVRNLLFRTGKLNIQNCEMLLGNRVQIDFENLSGIVLDTNGNALGTVRFTKKELAILSYLDRNDNRPVSREELLEHVWGYSRATLVETRTVDIHIAKLRRKIEENPKKPQMLVTVWGKGYRLMVACNG